MSVDAINSATGSTAGSSSEALSALNSEDFFAILITEMQNQDPFEPSDTESIINQVSQIRTIEQSTQLTETLDSLTQQQRLNGTTELIGKYVQAITSDSEGNASIIEGVVTGVLFSSNGSSVLELDNGSAISTDDVVWVGPLDESSGSAAEESTGEDEGKDDTSKSSLKSQTRDVMANWMEKLLKSASDNV